jgi:LPS O-antigen subunit length determinant protein (WzzB/FepE family)
MNINSNQQNFLNKNDEIELSEIIFALGQKKIWIFGFTLFFLLASLFMSLFLPDIYRSEAILKPAQPNEGSSQTVGAVAGVASLAGINLPKGTSTSNTVVAIETMKAFKFFEQNFLPKIQLENLMAFKSWDPANNSIEYKSNIFDSSTNTWVRKGTLLKKAKPSSQEAHKEFLKHHLSVKEDIETGLVTVSIEHKSAEVARNWANILVEQINYVMRQEKKDLSSKSVNFLSEQISTTRYAEVKEALANIVQRETEKLMLAEVDEDYVFHTIDPPYVAEEKAKPSRFLIMLIGAIIGMTIASIYVLTVYFQTKKLYGASQD